MNPQEEILKLQALVASLATQINAVSKWMDDRTEHLIPGPLDEASFNNIGAIKRVSPGAKALTQTIGYSAGGGSITVPAAFSGSIIIDTGVGKKEIPTL